MGIFSKSKKEDELMAVFNIGSSSVGGALFFAQSSGIPKIIFSVIEPLRLEEKVEADKFLSLTIEAVDAVAAKMFGADLGAPKRIFSVLSSPWYSSQMRTINLKKNTPFIFTEKLADELIQKEIKIFSEEHAVRYGDAGKGIRPIELKNIKTLLNGYEAIHPLEQKATDLEMNIFLSICGEQMLAQVEDMIRRHFHFETIKFSSFAMASFTVIRDMYSNQENFLLLDIGGEMTDIFLAKKNVLRESISYPLGINFLTRGVASRLGCTLGEAESLISLFKDGHAEQSVAKKLELVMVELKKEWLKNFQESLANLSKDISIPSTIFVIVDKNMMEFFSEIIKSEQFSQYTLTEAKFEVIFLGSQALHGAAQFEENVIRDPFLVVDAVYINRFLAKI